MAVMTAPARMSSTRAIAVPDIKEQAARLQIAKWFFDSVVLFARFESAIGFRPPEA